MSTTRKQDDYNEVLKTCDICLVMYWRRFGDFTGEELELAYQQMKRGEKPHKIYLFFKNLTDDNEITKDLRALKENIYTQYGHFICKFQHVDTMKLEFLLQLENYQKNILGESTLEVRNERVYVDNTPVVNLNNIPFAANNEGFKKLQKELQSINENIQKQESRLERKKEKLNTIKIKLENHPDDEDYLEDYNELKDEIIEIDKELQSSYNRRTLLEKEFEQEQKILFNTARRIIEQRGNNISNRTKRAIEAFENGYANKADIILNEAEHDAEQILTDIRLTKKIGLQSIEELMIKASIKMSNNTILIDERIKQTHQIYDQAITLAKEVGYESNKYCDLIEKFGDFLFEYGKYEEALYYRKEHMKLKEKLLSKNHVDLATSYIKYGQTLDYLDQSEEALNILKQALDICLKNYGEYHQLTAEAYNHLGNVLHDDNDSIKIHEKALNIRIKVLGENHPDTARSFNNLARKKNNIEALDYHQKALSIKLANLGKFHRSTGLSYLNIANRQAKLKDYSNALNNYIAANEIFKQVLV